MKIRLFKRKVKHISQRIINKFDDSETWSLDTSLAKVILPRLKRFKKLKCGYPQGLSEVEWDQILDKMIKSFEFHASEKKYSAALTAAEEGKYQEGLDLFGKWYSHLWW